MPPKISKIGPQSAPWSILIAVLDPLWQSFFIEFRKRRKLIFCNKSNEVLPVLHLKASHFGIKFRSKFQMFSMYFFDFFANLCKNV